MMSTKGRNLFLLASVAVLTGTGWQVSTAQNTAPATPVEVIKARQQSLKDLGASFKLIRDQVQSGSPDTAKIQAAAGEVKKAADAIATWFPQGTGAEAGVKTAAKPEIWSDPAGFTTAARNFAEQAGKFSQLTASGDAAAVGAGVKAVGQACGGCHEKFRVKES